MARPPARFRQDDVTRALRGAEAAGRKVRHTKIEPDGTIVLVHDEPIAPAPEQLPEPPPSVEVDL
jgi:hypothetical protein